MYGPEARNEGRDGVSGGSKKMKHTTCTKSNRVIQENHADKDGRCCYCPKKADKAEKPKKEDKSLDD